MLELTNRSSLLVMSQRSWENKQDQKEKELRLQLLFRSWELLSRRLCQASLFVYEALRLEATFLLARPEKQRFVVNTFNSYANFTI